MRYVLLLLDCSSSGNFLTDGILVGPLARHLFFLLGSYARPKMRVTYNTL